jgi:hypothetical protein
MERIMFDRHSLGDLAFAVLLALPLTGLAASRPATHQALHKAAVRVASSDLSPAGRTGLLG